MYTYSVHMGHEPTSLEVALSAEMRAEMAAQGISQGAMAQRVSISREALSRYLLGTRAMPVDVYLRISAALRLAPDELMIRAQKRDGK